jgi:hypothetical protein
VLASRNWIISAYCNEFAQNRWFFAISPNSGGSKYFPHKCGGYLELTLSSLLPSKPIELTYGEVKIKAMAWSAWKADMV